MEAGAHLKGQVGADPPPHTHTPVIDQLRLRGSATSDDDDEEEEAREVLIGRRDRSGMKGVVF